MPKSPQDDELAPLHPDDEEERFGAELQSYVRKRRARSRRKAALDAVIKDVEERGVPRVKSTAEYEMGKDGEVMTIVEPRDKDGNTVILIDTTGDGDTDAAIEFDGKKRVKRVVDQLDESEDEDEEEGEGKTKKPDMPDMDLADMDYRGEGIGEFANQFGDAFGGKGGGSGEKDDKDDYINRDMQMLGGSENPFKATKKGLAQKRRSYSRQKIKMRPRKRGRRRQSRMPGAMMR